MEYSSLGNIEVKGKLAAIVAADITLKAANVNLAKTETIRGGQTTIYIVGGVAAVQASIAAATEEVKKMNSFISSNVIANLDQQVMDMILKDLEKNEPNKDVKLEEEVKPEESSGNDGNSEGSKSDIDELVSSEETPETDETNSTDFENDIEEDFISPNVEETNEADNVDNKSEVLYDSLKKKKISELRVMAYDLVDSVSNKIIKNSRKDQIITLLINEGIDIEK